jgi:hypothetical protein
MMRFFVFILANMQNSEGELPCVIAMMKLCFELISQKQCRTLQIVQCFLILTVTTQQTGNEKLLVLLRESVPEASAFCDSVLQLLKK